MYTNIVIQKMLLKNLGTKKTWNLTTEVKSEPRKHKI